MQTHVPATPLGLSKTKRLACLAASVVTGAAVGTFVIALFGQASSMPWLPESPEAIALAQVCQQSPERRARQACMQQIVAEWQAAASRPLRLSSAR